MRSKEKVIICTKSAWTLYHFRLSLMLALKQRGLEVLAAASRDRYAKEIEAVGPAFADLPMTVAGHNPRLACGNLPGELGADRPARPRHLHAFPFEEPPNRLQIQAYADRLGIRVAFV